MYQQNENFYFELSLFEILSLDEMYLNLPPKRRLSVFEALSSESSSEQTISRTCSDISLSSLVETEPKFYQIPEITAFKSTEEKAEFDIGYFSIETNNEMRDKENIFSADDFKDDLSSANEECKSKIRSRRRKSMKDNLTSKKRKFRKAVDPLSEDIANQLFFDNSTKYPLVLIKKMESILLENV